MKALLNILNELHPDIDFETQEGLIDNMILDSFDIVSLVAGIHEEYGVSVTAEKIVPENFNSAKALYALIQELEED